MISPSTIVSSFDFRLASERAAKSLLDHARQYFVSQCRKVIDVVDKAKRHAVEPALVVVAADDGIGAEPADQPLLEALQGGERCRPARRPDYCGMLRRLPVPRLVNDVMVIVLGFLARCPTNEMTTGENNRLPLWRPRYRANGSNLFSQCFAAHDAGEQTIGVAHGKSAALLRITGADQDRITVEIGLRLTVDGLEGKIFAVYVERFVLSPDSLDDIQPFLGIGIAAIVILERDAEHLKFADIPSRH